MKRETAVHAGDPETTSAMNPIKSTKSDASFATKVTMVTTLAGPATLGRCDVSVATKATRTPFTSAYPSCTRSNRRQGCPHTRTPFSFLMAAFATFDLPLFDPPLNHLFRKNIRTDPTPPNPCHSMWEGGKKLRHCLHLFACLQLATNVDGSSLVVVWGALVVGNSTHSERGGWPPRIVLFELLKVRRLAKSLHRPSPIAKRTVKHRLHPNPSLRWHRRGAHQKGSNHNNSLPRRPLCTMRQQGRSSALQV